MLNIKNDYKEIDISTAKEIMLNILIDFDKICKRYDLTYWLTAGTLLGAVRHSGYIPWDDDIDIAMPREDYEKLNTLDFGSKLFLQNKKTDSEFTQYWSKIRHNDSIYLEGDELNKEINYNQGIFIDIFPMNCVKSNIMFYYPKLQYALDMFTSRNRFYTKLIKYDFRLPAINFLNRFDASSNEIFLESIDSADSNLKKVNKNDIFPLSEINFEGNFFPSPKNTDIYLKSFYGNTYMELPPEDQRKIHHYKIYLKNNE